MSSNQPPVPPNGPEYLESGGGRPLQPSSSDPGQRRGRQGLVAGGLVAALALLGVGGWAAWSFFSTGPQPAEALPGSTLAYVSVDLDPSGGQKIEALRTLRKFPAFKDKIGLGTNDDVRKRIFQEIEASAGCSDLDYGDDIEPWLGDRMAAAAVDTGGDSPSAVLVLQVTDEGKADAGLKKLRACAGGDSGAWSISDGWAVVGESQKVVDRVADDTADASLADDADFKHWTGEAGDAGIATAYVAPAAGKMLADNIDRMGLFGSTYAMAATATGTATATPSGTATGGTGYTQTPNPAPGELKAALRDFQGMAATLRFDNGSLELELAGDAGKAQQQLAGSDHGGEVLATLPDDTAAALGLGMQKGWFGDLVDRMSSAAGDGTSAQQLLDEMSRGSGLDLPQDAETLAGESAALAVGSDFDPEAFFSSPDSSTMPVGVKVKGDPAAIDSVLDKLRPQMGADASLIGSDSQGDTIAVGPDGAYRKQLLGDGKLGDSDVFRNVVRESDSAAAVLFVNFDAGDDWLSRSAEQSDPEVAGNLKPLQGLGLSAWMDGDVSHAVLRITTD